MKIMQTSQLALAMRVVDLIAMKNQSSELIMVVAPSIVRMTEQFHGAIGLMAVATSRKVLISSYAPDGLQNTYVFSYGKADKQEMKTILFIDDESGIDSIANATFLYLDGNDHAFDEMIASGL